MLIFPTRYPLQRAFQFVEAVSRDLSEQLLKLLAGERLMVLEFEAFETVLNSIVVFGSSF